MILSNILNSTHTLTDMENNAKHENIMMGRDNGITNDLRRAGFARSNSK